MNEEIEYKEEEEKTGSGTGSGTKAKTRKMPEKTKTRNEDPKKESQDQFRVVINKASSERLDHMLTQIQDGFEAGEVTKSDVANWIILAASDTFGENEVKSIRHCYFDERKILASLLKSSRIENNLPDNIKRAIRELAGLNEPNKKKLLKPI